MKKKRPYWAWGVILSLLVGCGGEANVNQEQSSSQNQNVQTEKACQKCLGLSSDGAKIECLDSFECPNEFYVGLMGE